MLSQLNDMILPHYCCSCAELGDVLCQSCRYDIASEYDSRCVSCLGPSSSNGRCERCILPYSRSWMVGMRTGALDRLVSVSKFDSIRRGCDIQAELLDEVLPVLPKSTIIVPVPTIARHIRQRGYGHAERIARKLAQRRGVKYEQTIGRRVQHVQHGASRRERKRQAAESYVVRGEVDDGATYLLVDDVFTTGFTMHYVATALAEAGASDIWAAVTSRQPLDEQG